MKEVNKLICWRGSDGDVEPVLCICDDKFGYPNRCTVELSGQSEQMYENTHFLKKEDAWKSIVASVKAGIMLSGRRVKSERENLKKAEKEAADCVEEYVNVMSNMDNPFRS